MQAEILAVGSEILLGDIQNTHARYLSQQLAEIGVDVLRHTAVGDNRERLKAAVQSALCQCDVLLVTGGLGPTQDDLTKEVVCDCLGLTLELDRAIQKKIEGYFIKMGRSMPENNLRQAMRPKEAEVLENRNGTAPGLFVCQNDKFVFLLPGPPSELCPLFEEQVAPRLSKKVGKTILSHNVHIFDIGESRVDELLTPVLDGKNPSVGIYAKDGEVRARVTAKADSTVDCEALLAPVVEKICGILGDHVYGIDVKSLENALVQKARSIGKTIATAESCTGGMVAQRITSIPGASECFSYGIVSYANVIKESALGVGTQTLTDYGAVSQQVAKEMAQCARKNAGADIGIGITGIAGPSGGTHNKPVGLVYIGIATAKATKAREYRFARGIAGERDAIRNRAAMQALRLAISALDE